LSSLCARKIRRFSRSPWGFYRQIAVEHDIVIADSVTMESDSQKHASRALNQPDFSGFLSSFLALNLGPRKISDVFSERPNLKSQLHRFHPVKSASLVAGLLTEPPFHANTLRLELLVHLLMAFAAGNRKAKDHDIHSWLNTDLGSTKLAFLEDPVEDVFVSNVTTQEGNVQGDIATFMTFSWKKCVRL